MSPIPRKSFFYKDKNATFGKSLATIGTKLVNRGFKKFKRFFASNGNGFILRKSLPTNSDNQLKIPFSEPLGIIIDSSDSAYSTDDGQSQKSRAEEILQKKSLAMSLLYNVSRPKDEMFYCKSFSENARYNNEGLSQALRQPRSYRKKNLLNYVDKQDLPNWIANGRQSFDDEDDKHISSYDIDEDLMKDLVNLWKDFKFNRPRRTKPVIVFNKFMIEGRSATLIDDVIIGSRVSLSKRATIRINEIKNYLEQSQPTSIQNQREKKRPPFKRNLVPVKPRTYLPEVPVQHQPQPQQPSLPPSLPQQMSRKRPSERIERIRRILPIFYQAYGNLTPFGPPVERNLLKKYMIDNAPLTVHPIDVYITANIGARCALFGTYFRTFQINGLIKKTFACFMNWEFVLNFYNMFNCTSLRMTNKARLNKQFVAKFFRKGLIARSLRNEKLHLHRMYLEKELLRYFLPYGVVYNGRRDLCKRYIYVRSKKPEIDLAAAKQQLTSVIKVKDPYYWCSILGRRSEDGSILLTKTDFSDYFENDLHSLLTSNTKKKLNTSESIKRTYLDRLKNEQVISRQRFERLDNMKDLPTESITRSEFSRKFIEKMPVVATVSEEIHSPGIDTESNETIREVMMLEKPSDDSLMDVDTQMGDNQMPHTPSGKSSQDDDDDIPYNSDVLHIGPSHSRYNDENPNISDVLSNRYLVMRLGSDCGKPIIPLYDELDNKGSYTAWSDSEEENEPLDSESRKRIFDAAEKETNVPEKMIKIDEHEKIKCYNDNIDADLESEVPSEYSEPEYITSGRADFPPMITAPLKISFSCLKTASLISKQFFKTSKSFIQNLDTSSAINILQRYVNDSNAVDSYEFCRSLSGLPNICEHLLKDAILSNSTTDLEELFLHFAKMQRFKMFKRISYNDFASQYCPLYNEIKLRRYYELAICNKMPPFTVFQLIGSCTGMPQYGQQLPKNSKAKVLPHNVVTHPKEGPILSTSSSWNSGSNSSSTSNVNQNANSHSHPVNQNQGQNPNPVRWPTRPQVRPGMTTLLPQRRPTSEGRITEVRRPEGRSIVTVSEGGSANTRIVTEVRTMPQSTEGRAMPQMTIVRTIVPVTEGRHFSSNSEVKATIEGRTNESRLTSETRPQIESRKVIPATEYRPMADEKFMEVKHAASDVRVVPMNQVKLEPKLEVRPISESRSVPDERRMPSESRPVSEGRTIPPIRSMEGRNVSESGGSDVRPMIEGNRAIRTVMPVIDGRQLSDGRSIVPVSRNVNNDVQQIAPVQQYQRYDDPHYHPNAPLRYPPVTPIHRQNDATVMKSVPKKKPTVMKKKFRLCTPHSAACSELIEDITNNVCKILGNLVGQKESVDGKNLIDKAVNGVKKQLPRYKYLSPNIYEKKSWKPFMIPRLNTRFKNHITKFTDVVCKNVRERFKNRQQINIIVRPLNKNELIAILKTYDAKYQLHLYVMLQHAARKMPYYDVRKLQVELRSFSARTNIRTLTDRPLNELTKKTERSGSLEPLTKIKNITRKRSNSFTDLKTLANERKLLENSRKRQNLSSIEVFPKRQRLTNPEKLELPAISTSQRLPIRIIPQKVKQYPKKTRRKRQLQQKARFLSLLDFSGELLTPGHYYSEKSFTKIYFTRIGSRWRLNEQLDDWWKSFRSPDESTSAFIF